MTETLWLDWIEDEKNVCQTEEEHEALVELFERAIEDYMCPKIWVEYIQYAIRWLSAEGGLGRFRKLISNLFINKLIQNKSEIRISLDSEILEFHNFKCSKLIKPSLSENKSEQKIKVSVDEKNKIKVQQKIKTKKVNFK